MDESIGSQFLNARCIFEDDVAHVTDANAKQACKLLISHKHAFPGPSVTKATKEQRRAICDHTRVSFLYARFECTTEAGFLFC